MIARLKNENNQLKSQLNNTGGTNTDIELLQMQLDDRLVPWAPQGYSHIAPSSKILYSVQLVLIILSYSKQYETRLQEDLREAHQKLMKLESDIELQSEAPSHTTLEVLVYCV